MPNDRIFRQIEATAAHYSPGTYANLLTYYNDLRTTPDLVQGQFIPLTQVKGRDTILFAVGVLPPTVRVTGRLLDRSASIASLDDVFNPKTTEETPQQETNKDSTEDLEQTESDIVLRLHRANRQVVKEAFRELFGRDPTLAELQYAQAVGWLETSYGRGWNGELKNSNNWGAVQCTARQVANGVPCGAYTDSNPDKSRYEVSFRIYSSPKEGAKDMLVHMFKHRTTARGLEGEDGSVFRASYIMRRQKYYGGWCPNATKRYGARDARNSFGYPDRNEGTKACAKEAISNHAKRSKQAIDDIALANKDPWSLGLGTHDDAEINFGPGSEPVEDGGSVDGDARSGDFAGDGKKAADAARKELRKLEGTQLNFTERGRRFLAAQAAQSKAVQRAIQNMENTPPLKLLVNPKSFGVKGDKIVQDGNWSRNGPIIEHWGDNQDTISASGTVAGFFAADALNAGGPGLTRYARNVSESWRNLQSLFLFYKNNGAIYLPEIRAGGTPGPQNLTLVGSIYIYYDNVLYIGSFSSFNLTEDATKPFTADYSFEFAVRSAFLLDRPNDPLHTV